VVVEERTRTANERREISWELVVARTGPTREKFLAKFSLCADCPGGAKSKKD